MQELIQIFKKQGQEFINDLMSDYVVVTEKLASVSSSALVNLPVGNVTSIQFDYEAVKNRYNKRRTVILPRAA